MIALRHYQEKGAAAFFAAVRSGRRRSLIVLPTGTGKTVMGLEIAKRAGGRCLWLAHRDELITQPLRALRAVWPEIRGGVVKASQNQFRAQVVFASIQTACRDARLEQLAEAGFDLIVVDEAHHATASTYKQVLEYFGVFAGNTRKLLVGFTATPKRAQQRYAESRGDPGRHRNSTEISASSGDPNERDSDPQHRPQDLHSGRKTTCN